MNDFIFFSDELKLDLSAFFSATKNPCFLCMNWSKSHECDTLMKTNVLSFASVGFSAGNTFNIFLIIDV